jgi:hypothetical protein
VSQRDCDDPHPARRLFDAAVDGLDADATRRLRLMRREALAGPRPEARRRWLPAAAFATALVVLGLGWRLARPPAAMEGTPAQAAMPVDLAADEDAALYAWLGEAPVALDESPL